MSTCGHFRKFFCIRELALSVNDILGFWRPTGALPRTPGIFMKR